MSETTVGVECPTCRGVFAAGTHATTRAGGACPLCGAGLGFPAGVTVAWEQRCAGTPAPPFTATTREVDWSTAGHAQAIPPSAPFSLEDIYRAEEALAAVSVPGFRTGRWHVMDLPPAMVGDGRPSMLTHAFVASVENSEISVRFVDPPTPDPRAAVLDPAVDAAESYRAALDDARDAREELERAEATVAQARAALCVACKPLTGEERARVCVASDLDESEAL